MLDFLLYYLVTSKRPLVKKCLHIPLKILIVGLALYQFREQAWAKFSAIIMIWCSVTWLLIGTLILMSNSVQEAHHRNPSLPAKIAGTQLLVLLPLAGWLHYLEPGTTTYKFAAPLFFFIFPALIVALAGLISGLINLRLGNTRDTPGIDWVLDPHGWESGRVNIPHLPLVAAASSLQEPSKTPRQQASRVELEWVDDNVSVSLAGQSCTFCSYQQKSHTNDHGERCEHRRLRRKKRSFPAKELAYLTNKTSQLQLERLRDDTLGVQLYRTSHLGDASSSTNVYIWLDAKTLRGTYIEEKSSDFSR